MDCGRRLEYLEETLTDTVKTCKLPTKKTTLTLPSGIESGIMLQQKMYL